MIMNMGFKETYYQLKNLLLFVCLSLQYNIGKHKHHFMGKRMCSSVYIIISQSESWIPAAWDGLVKGESDEQLNKKWFQEMDERMLLLVSPN